MTTNTTQHTPTPWRIGRAMAWVVETNENGAHAIANVFGPHPQGLGRGITELEANAAFIVRAVNTHAALVAAAEGVASQLRGWAINPSRTEPERAAAANLEGVLRYALALAEAS